MIQPIEGFRGAQTFVGPSLANTGGGNYPTRVYGNQVLKTAQGRVEDPELLDLITQ